MNLNGLFKVVLWLAPILAFVFFYISQQQAEHKVSIEKQSAEIDRDFSILAEKVTKDGRFAQTAQQKDKEIEDLKNSLKVEQNQTNQMREQLKEEVSAYKHKIEEK